MSGAKPSLRREFYMCRPDMGGCLVEFVFGYKKNNVWEFYFYGNGLGGVVTVKRM
jgi:hypothetical protein